jgi:hypothetical protein
MFSMTSRMYWALTPGEVKDPSIRSDHGSNSWQILGNWLSSLNQMKMREHIIAGVVHLAGKTIPAKNRAVSTPRKRTGTWFFQLDKAGNSGKMNRQTPRTVPVEEHEELVSMVQTLQLQLRALSTQVLSITEITIQHRSEQQRNRDECEALRQQIEALKFVVGPASPTPSQNTYISDEASSPGLCPQLDLNLRPPTEADSTAPDHNKFKCMQCFFMLLLGTFCMVFTIDTQIGFSILVSATPALHFLLGEFRRVHFDFCNFCNKDSILCLRFLAAF